MADETSETVETVASATSRTLNSLTPRRILALFTITGFLFLGAELGRFDVPFPLGLLGFAYFAIAAMHAWNRGPGLTGIDMVIAGHVLVAVIVVGVQLEVVNVPGAGEWAKLLILALIVGDGFIAHRD